MAESEGESNGREVIDVSSDSDPEESRRLEEDFRFLLAQLGHTVPVKRYVEMSGAGINQYLERPDANERAQQRAQSSASASTSRGHSSSDASAGEIVRKELVRWHLSDGLPVKEAGRSMTEKEIAAMRHKYRIPGEIAAMRHLTQR